MDKLVLSLITLLLIACSNQPEEKSSEAPLNPKALEAFVNPKTPEATPTVSSETSAEEAFPLTWEAGEYTLTFEELSSSQLDSLQRRIVSTSIPISDPAGLLTRTDSCLLVQIDETNEEAFCDFDDGEYHESYQVKGLWTGTRQLLMTYQNWEEHHDFLINLSNGEKYILGPEYRLSPDQSLMLSFTNLVQYPIYSNGFILTKFNTEGFIDHFNIDFGVHTVTAADWLSDQKLLIGVAQVDLEKWQLENEKRFILSWNN